MRQFFRKRLDMVADTLLRPINPAVIVIVGAYTILWGLWLISPWWSVFGHSIVYSQMASVAPEYVWGFFAVFCGWITCRGAMIPIYWNLDIGALVGALFWLLITLFYFFGYWASTAGLSAAAFAVYFGMIWLNVRMNREHFGYDDEYLSKRGK